MLLSYGLHREAGAIFAQLIEKGASPAVRDRAWFYLAKIRYQRGYLPEAEDALAQVENHLPPALEEERVLLQANLLMARADYAGAADRARGDVGEDAGRALRPLQPRHRADQVRRRGARHRGARRTRPRQKAEDEEYRSLRDRANVALGFAALTENRPKEARTYLERVRLKSLQSNKALLGFGWAAEALKDPKLALVPWIELAQRDVSDSAALEAQIAVPYAYAELGAYGQSLERYNDAIAAFERESTGLNESIAAIRSGKLVEALIERNPGDEMGWFWRMRDLPELPHAAHLAQVLAQHEFQEAFKNYRDLRFLTKNLGRVAREARRLRRHAGDAAQGLRRAPAAGAPARQRDRARRARRAPRQGRGPGRCRRGRGRRPDVRRLAPGRAARAPAKACTPRSRRPGADPRSLRRANACGSPPAR